jgi:hypothetical protein
LKCIYCKKETGARVGIAHIFPEALHANDEVLPRGSVCDGCNQYLGRRLDENLIRYPSVALAIQFLATPGKSGKSRKLIGAIEREIPGQPDALFRTFTEKPTIVTAHDGSRRAIVELKCDRQFRMSRFRRALHHVAFNVIAKMEGPAHMLADHWDAARKYIRSPKNEAQSWGFAQLTPSMDSIPHAVQGVRWESGRRELVSLQIFQSMFVVDLMNTGDLEKLAREQDAEYIGPAKQEPHLVTFELSEDSE